MCGSIESSADITIEGRVTGPIWSDGHEVVIAESGKVTGDIFARDIIVFGSVSGTLLASGLVEVHASARVTGRIVSGRLFVEDGAWLDASAEPHQLAAALEVARFRFRQAQTPGQGNNDPRSDYVLLG